MQTIVASVQSLVGGLKQVNEEIRELQKMRIPQDRFVIVMQVSEASYGSGTLTMLKCFDSPL